MRRDAITVGARRLRYDLRLHESASAMPYDITMCPGEGCPLRSTCYRARAVPLGRQDWFGRPPYDPVTQTCAHFWDVARLAPTEADIRHKAYFLWVTAGRPEGQSDAHWHAAKAALEAAARALVVDETG
jgi:Protein of unknown function (DUF2934)